MATSTVIFTRQMKQFRVVFCPNHTRNFVQDRNRKLLFYRLRVRMSEYDESFSSVGGNNINEPKSFSATDIVFPNPAMFRRQSTLQDEQQMIFLLVDMLEDRNKNLSSWALENKAKVLCFHYKNLLDIHKEGFLKALATNYCIDQERVCNALRQYGEFQPDNPILLKAVEQLRSVITPQYTWLFKIIGRLDNGMKFLVDMRTDVIMLIHKMPSTDSYYIPLQHLNNTLRELLSLWFCVGFLKLERITWQSPCEMLQKVCEYEAVHPVRSWADLKRRVGLYRRCYVFTHNSMPQEPIVVLHTALTSEISSSIKAIVTATQRMSSVDSADGASGMFGPAERGVEDPLLIKAAIFYSISSTQRGLFGIELGNYLIKTVVREVQAELPHVTVFSSLSPVPLFRNWLVEKMKSKENNIAEPAIDLNGWDPVLSHFDNSWPELINCILSNLWHSDEQLVPLLQEPLMKTCAFFLLREKVRSFVYDPVANFHLRNGAVMWRLNWLADTTPRGMSNSCGLMVNYRYYLDQLEFNSRNYIEKKIVVASDEMSKLLPDDQ